MDSNFQKSILSLNEAINSQSQTIIGLVLRVWVLEKILLEKNIVSEKELIEMTNKSSFDMRSFLEANLKIMNEEKIAKA